MYRAVVNPINQLKGTWNPQETFWKKDIGSINIHLTI